MQTKEKKHPVAVTLNRIGGESTEYTLPNSSDTTTVYTPPEQFKETVMDYYVIGSYEKRSVHLINGEYYREQLTKTNTITEEINNKITLCNQSNARHVTPLSVPKETPPHYFEWFLDNNNVTDTVSFDDINTDLLQNLTARIAHKQIPLTPGTTILSRVCGNCERKYAAENTIQNSIKTAQTLNNILSA